MSEKTLSLIGSILTGLGVLASVGGAVVSKEQQKRLIVKEVAKHFAEAKTES